MALDVVRRQLAKGLSVASLGLANSRVNTFGRQVGQRPLRLFSSLCEAQGRIGAECPPSPPLSRRKTVSPIGNAIPVKQHPWLAVAIHTKPKAGDYVVIRRLESNPRTGPQILFWSFCVTGRFRQIPNETPEISGDILVLLNTFDSDFISISLPADPDLERDIVSATHR
jgi:hypothetical protein